MEDLCTLIRKHLEKDQTYRGTIQISSNDKTNPQDPNSNFKTNLKLGITGEYLVLDSIYLTNSIQNINSTNFQYVLNGFTFSLPIGQYNTILDLCNMLAFELTTQAGHFISFIYNLENQIEIIGTLGFTDSILFDSSISRMLGFNTGLITVTQNIPVISQAVPNKPQYSRWANVTIYGLYDDRSFVYSKSNSTVLSCVPLGNFGDQIIHREVEFRPLKINNYISGVQVVILDEYSRELPIGNESVVISMFYK